jgi:predicted NUDIX family NTP pyrophosphohydrolase
MTGAYASGRLSMKLPRDGILHVALVLPDGRFYAHSVQFPRGRWARSMSRIRDVERWLDAARRDIVEQLRDDGID